MDEKKLTFGVVDRSNWAANGPWKNEPDKVEWQHAGFPCFLRRGGGGSWCGYVALPKSHSWASANMQSGDVHMEVDVHGGITYGPEGPREGFPECGNVRWIGFDANHISDHAPDREWSRWAEGVYRTMEYMVAETERLVDQCRNRTAL